MAKEPKDRWTRHGDLEDSVSFAANTRGGTKIARSIISHPDGCKWPYKRTHAGPRHVHRMTTNTCFDSELALHILSIV